jgi:hypothetical protein
MSRRPKQWSMAEVIFDGQHAATHVSESSNSGIRARDSFEFPWRKQWDRLWKFWSAWRNGMQSITDKADVETAWKEHLVWEPCIVFCYYYGQDLAWRCSMKVWWVAWHLRRGLYEDALARDVPWPCQAVDQYPVMIDELLLFAFPCAELNAILNAKESFSLCPPWWYQ